MQVKQGPKALNQITFASKSPNEKCQNIDEKEHLQKLTIN